MIKMNEMSNGSRAQPIQKIIKRIDEKISFSVVINFCLEIGFLFLLLL